MRRVFYVVAALLAVGGLGVDTARAALVVYQAPGGSFDPTTVDPHATATPLSDAGSAAELEPGSVLPNSVFLRQRVDSPDPAAAVANAQFFHFTIAPQPGYALNLGSLAFDASRGGSSTPRGWVLRSSLDGYAADIATAAVPTLTPTYSPFNVPLPAAFQNLTAPVNFRIYGYAPPTPGVGMFYDNLTVDGTINSINTLVRYEAPGGSFTPTAVADHVFASDLSDAGSAAELEPGSVLPNSVFLRQRVESPDPAAAVANSQYFEFTAAAQPGFELDLQSLSFDAARGGSSTPRGWVLRSSLDNFAADIATGEVPTPTPTLTPFVVDLTGAMFQDVTSQVTFRLYGYAPPTAGVGMFYDNIELHGLVAAVPEPASALLAAAGAVATMLRRRRLLLPCHPWLLRLQHREVTTLGN